MRERERSIEMSLAYFCLFPPGHSTPFSIFQIKMASTCTSKFIQEKIDPKCHTITFGFCFQKWRWTTIPKITDTGWMFFRKFHIFLQTDHLNSGNEIQETIPSFGFCFQDLPMSTVRAHQMPFFRCKFNMTGMPAFLSVFQTLKSVSIKLCK